MRTCIVTAIVLAATPAAAEPVTSARTCTVELVRAPEDVRPVVEAWIASARRCSVALDVRIVPTPGGLYVLAQDDRGMVRDRIVPDAQTAGALIASWADDGAPAPVTVDVHTEVTFEPSLAPITDPVPIPDAVGGPGAVRSAGNGEPHDDASSHARNHPSHWVGEFGMVGGGNTSFRGLRGEVDVIHGSSWTAGLAVTIAYDQMSASNGDMTEVVSLSDLSASAYVAHAMRVGGWEVRPAIGAGVVYTRALHDVEPTSSIADLRDYVRVSPIAEASLLASHALVGNLAGSLGALLTAYGQKLDSTLPELQYRGLDAVLVLGLRFGFL